MFEVRRYTATDAPQWNEFVAKSKNGTFLFDRRYMDYHSDRFHDASLIAERDGTMYALLPGNVVGQTFYSHQGLTYGGLILGNEATTVHVMECFSRFNDCLRQAGIRRVVYKAKPWIYHLQPAEEPIYAMHRTCSYRLLERDLSSTIRLHTPLKWKKDRRHGLRLARERGIVVSRSDDYEAFWDILTENLRTAHDVSPVHTVAEMRLLRERFPEQIFLYTATLDNQLLAGCVVYLTQQVVHTQYIGSTPEGRRMGAVDAIIGVLAGDEFPAHTYLDFGKSTETHSDELNANLLYQKEGFGARAVCYDVYEWEL